MAPRISGSIFDGPQNIRIRIWWPPEYSDPYADLSAESVRIVKYTDRDRIGGTKKIALNEVGRKRTGTRYGTGTFYMEGISVPFWVCHPSASCWWGGWPDSRRRPRSPWPGTGSSPASSPSYTEHTQQTTFNWPESKTSWDILEIISYKISGFFLQKTTGVVPTFNVRRYISIINSF